jgi:serine/threonine protein phosphatase PrpC
MAVNPKETCIFSNQGKWPGQEDASFISDQKRIFVVADGFGGPVPGAAASKAACESIRTFLIKEAGDEEATMPFELRPYFSLAGNVLFNAVIHANRMVNKLNQKKSVHERGGTSLLAGYMDGDLLALACAGSCTAWLIRGGEARELVTPRTLGRMSDPFGPRTFERQVPLMALGVHENLEPEIFEYRIRPGDWLFLHTDGIMSDAVERVRDLQTVGLPSIQGAVQEALSQFEYLDNATAALVVF